MVPRAAAAAGLRCGGGAATRVYGRAQQGGASRALVLGRVHTSRALRHHTLGLADIHAVLGVL